MPPLFINDLPLTKLIETNRGKDIFDQVQFFDEPKKLNV